MHAISTPTIAFLVAAALAAGFVDAIAGGGGLVTVPALLAAGLPPHVALATNKGQAIFGAISSFSSFWRQGGVDRARAPIGFVAGLVGSCAGARVLLMIRPEPLKPIVLALLVGVALFVAWPRRVRTREAAARGERPSNVTASEADGPSGQRRLWAFVPVACALGFYDGFFGPGTGSMLIVASVLLFGDTLTRASGNAKVVNLASNLAAVTLFAWRGSIAWEIAAPMAVANACGAQVGARLALRIGDRFVRAVVLVVVLTLVGKMAVDVVLSTRVSPMGPSAAQQ